MSRTRAQLEQSIEDAIEEGKEENLTRYFFEILLDIRDYYVNPNKKV